jgi:hypothetical protein
MKQPLPISERAGEVLTIGSPKWRKVCTRLNELDSKGWKNLSQEEVDEHQKLFKQLPN